MKKLILIFFIACLFSVELFSQRVFNSVANGDWDEASTWTIGAGSGGAEGISYPAPTDSVIIRNGDTVFIDLTNNGNNYEFEGYLKVENGGLLRCGMGAGADDGFLFVQNAFADIYGHFYVAVAGQGPGTVGPTQRDLDIEDNAIFRVFDGAYLYLADDWFIRDNSIVVVRGSVCAEIDDDMQIEDDAILCRTGGASINVSTVTNTLSFAGGASAANICSGVSIYRGAGAACALTGTLVQAGTGPAGLKPVGLADVVTTFKNDATDVEVLAIGRDYDLDGDTLEILSTGSNLAVSNNASTQGGTLSLNDNASPTNFLDDYIVYTPSAGFLGIDQFSYIIEDEQGVRDTVEVSVFVIECGTYIELLGSGANGIATTSLNFSDTTEIDSIVMESIYKGAAPTSITFSSSTQTIVNSSPVAAINGGGGYFRTKMNAAGSISATTTNTTTT